MNFLQRFLRWLKPKHKHKWKDSALNGYGITIEEKCRCGAYRHHHLRDRSTDHDGYTVIRWREGKHPGCLP